MEKLISLFLFISIGASLYVYYIITDPKGTLLSSAIIVAIYVITDALLTRNKKNNSHEQKALK